MGVASFIGEPLMVVSVAVSGFLVAKGRDNEPAALAFIVGLLAFIGNTILKQFLHRTRQDTLYVTAMRFKSYSFPSGHAFGSVVIFGLIAYLAARYWSPPWNWLTAAGIALLIILIGLSRVYLGAHFPSDVLGGWFLGGVVLFLIIKFILV